MKKLLLIFSAFALIVVLSSFNFSKHEMIEVEEFQEFNYDYELKGVDYFTESTSSKYDSDKNLWNNTNKTFTKEQPIIKGLALQLKTLNRMEVIVFDNYN